MIEQTSIYYSVSKYFFFKKYTLLSLCGLYIILLLIYPLIADYIGDHQLSANIKGLYEADHERILWVNISNNKKNFFLIIS